MTESLGKLVDSLRLEQLDKELFRGSTWPPREYKTFGGQVLAQAMSAAIQTIESDRRIHSQHAYFLLAGDTSKPIIYEVEPIRNGRSFSTRRVLAIQDSRAIFTSVMSFQVDEGGFEHQDTMPDVPSPDEIENDIDYFKRKKHGADTQSVLDTVPLDFRSITKRDLDNPTKGPASFGVWMRANGTMPDDRAAHETMLAYMSDSYFMSTSMLPHGLSYKNKKLLTASLDHGLWFHDTFRADEWLYHDMRSPRASHSRGLNHGSIYARDGRLVASATQEGLFRLYDE